MRHKPTTVEALTMAAVAAVLIWAIIAFGWNNIYGESYVKFGQELGRKQQEVRLPGDYKYVVDLETRQYWPYQSKYVEAIPRERRVYVLDAETLAQFKGYQPGPL